MSTQPSHAPTLSILHSLIGIGSIIEVFALLVILIIVILFLVEYLDMSKIITSLSDIRVTPTWPQIGSYPTLIH